MRGKLNKTLIISLVINVLMVNIVFEKNIALAEENQYTLEQKNDLDIFEQLKSYETLPECIKFDEQFKNALIDINGHSPLIKEDITKWNTLKLNNYGLKNIEGIKYFTDTLHFDFSFNEIESLKNFENVVLSMHDLKMANNNISDITPLEKLIAPTQRFDFSSNNIQAINKQTLQNILNATNNISRFWTLNDNHIFDFSGFKVLLDTPLNPNQYGGPSYNYKIMLYAENQNVTMKEHSVDSDNMLIVQNPLKSPEGTPIEPQNISNNGIYNKTNNTIIWKNLNGFDEKVTFDFKNRGPANKSSYWIISGKVTIPVSNKEQIPTQTIKLGGQGIQGRPDGFSRISLEVKDHKLSLIKHSDYQFHWYFNNKKYVGIKIMAPTGKILYDESWNGNQKVQGNGNKKFGVFAQYDIPENSTIEIYHAEGWHGKRYETSDYDTLKKQSGNIYTYKIQNNQLVLTSVV